MSRWKWMFLVPGILVILSRPALPCGPGVHIREARTLLQMLAAGDPAWAEAAQDPLADAYLSLGAVAPDFQWAISEITFGHDFSLAYHLLDRGEQTTPRLRLFGLGFLSHVTASDPACEQFYAPTMMALAGTGIVDLNASYDGPKGEAEMLFESLGDVLLGDWDPLVETLWTFWVAGNEARTRGQEVFTWYCEEGSAFLHRPTDCSRAWDEFAGLLAQADGILGGMALEEMKDFVHSILDQPMPGLLDLFLSGFLQQFLGDRFVASANFAREKERFYRSPFATREFWNFYGAGLGLLGPSFAMDRLVLRNDDFPSWIDKPLITGNIQAAMATLPEEFAVIPGLLVDGLEWRDEQNRPLSSLVPMDQGRTLSLWVRLYSTYRIAGEVRVLVKGDRPGNDTASDPILGEGLFPIVMNPLQMVRIPREEFVLPFQADLQGVRGLYAEFYFGDSPLPWFSTNWDRVWLTGAFDFEQPATWQAFGTYGKWPPSLPVAGADVLDPWVFVKVRVAPAGGGVEGARVVLRDGDTTREVVTGWNGIAVFPETGLDPVNVTATAGGHQGASTPVEVAPRNLDAVWSEVFLHALPSFRFANGTCVADRRCISFSIAPEPFQDQVSSCSVTAETITEPTVTGPSLEVQLDKAVTACLSSDVPDGSPVRLRATPRYRDGTSGVEGLSEVLVLDASAPEGGAPQVMPTIACRGEAGPPRGFTVSWEVTEPHSPLSAVSWRIEGDFVPLPEEAWTTEEQGRWQISFSLPLDAPPTGQRIHLRARNCAGLSVEATVDLPDWSSLPPCQGTDLGPEPSLDEGSSTDLPGTDLPGDTPGEDPMRDSVSGADGTPEEVTPPAKGSGGCRADAKRPSSSPAWLALAALGLLVVRRQRRSV